MKKIHQLEICKFPYIRHRHIWTSGTERFFAIRNHTNEKVYIGSTTQRLSKRWKDHKNMENKNSELYQAMDEIGIEQFYIELIEDHPCENREQLCAREGHYIRQFDSVNNGYNMYLTGRTRNEWRKDTNEPQRYYDEHKDAVLERQKQYYQENKDKKKDYYDRNFEHIQARRGAKFECECGGSYTRQNRNKHLQTQKHCQYYQREIILLMNIEA